ncbi:hypothetical protein [Candidatus Nitrospira bockiana]
MDVEPWIAKKPTGEEWGYVNRLLVNPRSRRVTVELISKAGSVIRVPWTKCRIGEHYLVIPQRGSVPYNGG